MTIIYSRQAQDDILAMKMYVSGGSGESKTAADIAAKIKDKVSELEIFPKRHKVWENSEYRFFSVNNYLVFYRYDEAAEKIIVERVIYTRRDIETLL